MRLTRREFIKKSFFSMLTLLTAVSGYKALFRFTGKVLAMEKDALYEAKFYRKLKGKKVQCDICFRKCMVSDGHIGFCRNKVNKGGKYYTLVYNKPCAIHVDPVEKEPSFHMLPGSDIYCIATASCNSRCKFCHNWHISQSSVDETLNQYATPEDIVRGAERTNSPTVSFTYSEPMAFYEYMFDVAKLAKASGLKTLCHTNGQVNKQPLLALLQYMDAVTVDLKAFTEEFYRDVCTTKLETVLETIKIVKKEGKHLELVNLVIPTLNDNLDDIRRMCLWIKKNVGVDTPLHFNRFWPAYKLRNLPPTPLKTIEDARDIAEEVGLRYIYIGNMPGHKYNNTFCPQCKKRIIHRTHFRVYENSIEEGRCKFCGYKIPGIWV